jgi:Uncharacterized protein conserved in bacteria
MQSWHLANADELARENRYTFYKPSEHIIQKVAVGEVVKLIFRFESEDPDAPAAERMWVLVDEIGSQGRFKGRLNNEPRHITDLKLDDPIEFQACHIINTEHDDNDNLVEKYIRRCFVTNRVLRDGIPVGYLYREEPDCEDDSGWRFTANDETVEYMEDSDNSAYVSIGAVLSKDDSFVALLESPAGSAFVRDSESGEFVPCTDEG